MTKTNRSNPLPSVSSSLSTVSSLAFGLIDQRLTKIIKDSLNIHEPTAIQSQAIPSLLYRNNTPSNDAHIVHACTGSGKTLAFLLPMLTDLLAKIEQQSSNSSSNNSQSVVQHEQIRLMGTMAMIVVPTKELAQQTLDLLELLLTKHRVIRSSTNESTLSNESSTSSKRLPLVVCGMLIGSQATGNADGSLISRKSEKARLRRGINIVVGTPGRLLDHLESTQSWRTDQLSWLVLDEADRLLDLGFAKKVEKIVQLLAQKRCQEQEKKATIKDQDIRIMSGGCKLIACSATMEGHFVEELLKKSASILFSSHSVDSSNGTAKQGNIKINKIIASSASKDRQSDSIVQVQSNDGSNEQSIAPVIKYSVPAEISQFYLLTSTRDRLAALACLLQREQQQTVASHSLHGSQSSQSSQSSTARIIVFFSCCDAVDFYARLFWQCSLSDSSNQLTSTNSLSAQQYQGKSEILQDATVVKLHGSMDPAPRQAAYSFFSSASSLSVGSIKGKSLVLFCTDVAARGLDMSDISTVIHYDAPNDLADYVHRIGRTGRTGGISGKSVLMVMQEHEKPVIELLAERGCTLSDYQQAPGQQQQQWSFFGKKMQFIQDAIEQVVAADHSPSQQQQQLSVQAKSKQSKAQFHYQQRQNKKNDSSESGKDVSVDVALLPSLHSLARKAYTASVRAYATHVRSQRHIFHVKSLHLGHFARSFGLKDAPSNIVKKVNKDRQREEERAANQSHGKRSYSDRKTGNGSASKRAKTSHSSQLSQSSKASKDRNSGKAPKSGPSSFSEFDAF